MPYSAGTFTLPLGNPVVTGTTIASTWANSTLTDIATGLSTAILKDGTQTVSANIPLGGFKATNLGASSAAGDAVRYQQVFTTTPLTDAATISWDASLAPVATVTIAGSRIMAAPTNLKAGGLYGLIVTQDGTGGRTLTWNAVFKGQGSGTMPQPETAAAAVTQFNFYSPDGTNLNCVQCMPFIDSNCIVRGSGDPTKKLRFEVDGFTTATTRVVTLPDADITIPNLASQTANTVLAGPASGGAGAATFRALVAADLGTQAFALLNSGTVTNAATVDIVMTSYTGYRNKLFVFSSFVNATAAADFYMRVSTNGGVSYDAGAANYAWMGQGLFADAASPSNSSASATQIDISGNTMVASASYGISGNIYFYDTTNTAQRPQFSWNTVYNNPTHGWTIFNGGGVREAAQKTDAVRFLMSGGNITSGIWALFGFN